MLLRLKWGSILVVIVGCGGGGGGLFVPAIPQVSSSAKVTSEVTQDPNVPTAEEPTNALLLQLLQACVGQLGAGEAQLIAQAARSRLHEDVILWSLYLYQQAIASDGRLIGRDMPVRYLGPGIGADTTGNSINVIASSSVPGLPTFNAFALENVIVMLDPLMNAFMEGAAFWDRLVENAGDVEDLVDVVELLVGFGEIFFNNMQGDFGLVVSPQEVADRIQFRQFAFEAYWGAVAYVVFHELGHANLGHGLFKCLVKGGVAQALADAGITPTQQELNELNLALATLDRGTEAQADIYAATISANAGFSSNGAAIFILGFLALKLETGECDAFIGNDPAFEACLVGSAPENGHPPLDVRAEIASSIIDEGQDLTPLLDLIDALSLG